MTYYRGLFVGSYMVHGDVVGVAHGEESVDRAVAAFPEAEAIFERNMETLEKLGTPGWDDLRRQWEDDAARETEAGAKPRD